MRKLALALFVVAFTTRAAEVPLSAPVYRLAERDQLQTLAASSGDEYLVLWSDSRSSYAETRATRVDRDGRVIDTVGIHVLPKTLFEGQMVWTGTSYLVIWWEHDAIRILRLDREAHVIDGPRELLAHAVPASIVVAHPHVVIGYQRIIPTSEARALFITPEGVPVSDVRLGNAMDSGGFPSIAWNGSHFAAAWSMFERGGVTSVQGVRFDIGGAFDLTQRILIDGRPYVNQPRLASDGHDFLLWTVDHISGFSTARRISADFQTVGEPMQLPADVRNDATLAWSGSSYIVTGTYGRRLSAVRLDRDGRELSRNLLEESPYGVLQWPVAVLSGGDLFVAWTTPTPEGTTQTLDVFATLASATTLQRRAGGALTQSAKRQSPPIVVSGATNLLALWHEGSQLWVNRLALDGTPLAEPMLASENAAAETAAAFNGRDYIIAWRDGLSGNGLTRRVSGSGPLVIDGGATLGFAVPLALASNGTTTLLVANHSVVRLGADAAPIDPVPLQLPEDVRNQLVVSAGDDEFLVVWSKIVPVGIHFSAGIAIRAARITNSLVSLDPNGFDIVSPHLVVEHPTTAWNGGDWLVAWTQNLNEIHARRVAPNVPLVGDELVLAQNARRGDLAWDGARYLFAWTGEDFRLRSAWITRLGDAPLSVRDHGLGESTLDRSIMAGPFGVAYARIAPEPQYGGVARAFVDVMRFNNRRRAAR